MSAPDNYSAKERMAQLDRTWGKTNLGDHESVQIFLMCFDALWPQIKESLSGPSRNCPHSLPGNDVCRFMFEAEERGDWKIIRPSPSATKEKT